MAIDIPPDVIRRMADFLKPAVWKGLGYATAEDASASADESQPAWHGTQDDTGPGRPGAAVPPDATASRGHPRPARRDPIAHAGVTPSARKNRVRERRTGTGNYSDRRDGARKGER